MNEPSSLKQAIKHWESALTEQQVITRPELIDEFNQTTFKKTGSFQCVLLPTSSEQLSECLKIANKFKINIYTVSQGKNYGLGSKLSVVQDQVLIDLSKMNKITDFSEKMAYITVQPGVTFRQVSEYLESKESQLIMDSIGSTGEASIIGNTAERGHGVALNADRFASTCGMEVVLATGEIIHTGFGSLEQQKLSSLSKWGLGPSLDGLFTQSNLGIITSLTLWLQPKPEHFQIILFHIEDDDNLQSIIEAIRPARLKKLSLSLRIFNDYRMIGFSKQYPWKAMNDKTPLSKEVLEELKKESGIKGKWVGLGALYSINKDFAKAEKNYIKKLINPFTNQLEFYDEEKATQIKNNGTPDEQRFIDFIFFKSSLQGYTSENTLNMCYWRKREPIPDKKDIHRDKCGVLWYCPAIPNADQDVKKAIGIVEETSLKYNLEPNIGFLFISERSLDITGAICYDKNDPVQDEAARKCHDEILKKFLKAGYPPYRLGIQSMDLISNYSKEYKTLLKTLKKALDPENIMSRQRYIPDNNHY